MSATAIPSMAWRNIWRNTRRTLITMSSIAFGFMLAILFTGLGDSAFGEMIDVAARMGGGHVTIQHRDALERPSLSRTVEGVSRLSRIAVADPRVERTAARITGQLVLATAAGSRGAWFIAFDPGMEDEQTLGVHEAIGKGRMPADPDERSIVLGSTLAENLGAGLGKKVVFTATDRSGEIVSTLARVVGILETGAPSADAGLCLVPLGTMRKALGYGPDEAGLVAVFLSDSRHSEDVAARLSGSVGDQADVLTWRQTQPDISGFIAMKVGSTIVFEIIIAVIIAAGIFNTLFVSVMERLREFGVLMAIGFSPWRLFGLVMWESLWLGIAGLAAGLLVTAGPYWWFWSKGLDMSAMTGAGGTEISGVAVDPIMRVAIHPENAIAIAGAALAATLLAGLYPAIRAGRVAPVDSIKLV